MNTKLQALLAWRVPPLLFAAACLIMVGLTVNAKLLADGISLLVGNALEAMAQPTPGLY